MVMYSIGQNLNWEQFVYIGWVSTVWKVTTYVYVIHHNLTYEMEYNCWRMERESDIMIRIKCCIIRK